MSSRMRMVFALWMKLLARSPWFWLLLVCSGISVSILMNDISTERVAVSVIYEKLGMLIIAFTMISVFILDMDSGFMNLLRSYPVRRIVLLIERGAIGYFAGIAIVLLSGILLPGNIPWTLHLRYLLFMLPVYWTMGALTAAGTLLVQHTVGGLFGALMFWSAAMSQVGGEYSPILLNFSGVHLAVIHWWTQTEAAWENWLVFNRWFYCAVGILLWSLAWFVIRIWKKR